MNTRKLVVSSVTALMIVAGNAAYADNLPDPATTRVMDGYSSTSSARDSKSGSGAADRMSSRSAAARDSGSSHEQFSRAVTSSHNNGPWPVNNGNTLD